MSRGLRTCPFVFWTFSDASSAFSGTMLDQKKFFLDFSQIVVIFLLRLCQWVGWSRVSPVPSLYVIKLTDTYLLCINMGIYEKLVNGNQL